jgi:UDP-N-acetylglucosamine--N-acetylmuramyl-(pentapeptide) pyrophosphoryl-undecaprenol N-acetylglucosamine transferase
MRILIAAGGTGGHIYPALAVVRSLRERRSDVDLRWVGGHRGLETGLVAATGIPFTRLWLRSLRSVDVSVHALLDPLRLGASVTQAGALLAGWRPDAIFTTGGYVSIPLLTVAAPLGIPSLLWEGNVVPGRSSRVVGRMARAVAVSFAETCASFRGACYTTGTPIRDLSRVDLAGARERFDIGAEEHVLLVFGGSQTVQRFEDAVASVLPELARRAVVIHVAGERGYGEALRRRESLPQELRERYRPFPFLREEMTDALAAADLVVGRAGSSTVAEVTALGLPMVVVPYPHAGGHQRQNARVLAEAGAAVLIEDEAFDGERLLAATHLLEDVAALERMRATSRALGRPRAADANTELLLALADHGPLPSREVIDRAAGAAA